MTFEEAVRLGALHYCAHYAVPPEKIASIVGEMVRSPEMMKRRLREGVEFFKFLRQREVAA